MSWRDNKIRQEGRVKSMENENGLFVKMNQLSIEVIKSIYEYVGVVRESKKDLETAIQSMEPVRDIINKNVQEDVDEITSNDVNIEVEDWKMGVFTDPS